MRQFGEILGLGLQEIREERESEAKTILEFLRERMDGADRLERRKTLAERLGWKGMACCGATWAIRPSTISIRDDEDEDVVGPLQPQHQQEEQQIEVIDVGRIPPETNSDPGCDGEGPVVSGMNLADALAAERQFRAADLDDGSGLSPNPSPVRPNSDVTAPETPLRVSLMRLLEETDGGDGAEEVEKGEKGVGNDSVCCVCMGRKKGAAFIPCGHTFCRVCSRELWLNRGSCPLCNRPIVEILDIF